MLIPNSSHLPPRRNTVNSIQSKVGVNGSRSKNGCECRGFGVVPEKVEVGRAVQGFLLRLFINFP